MHLIGREREREREEGKERESPPPLQSGFEKIK